MNRVERFRQARTTKHRFIISVLVFMFLLVAGMCTADYSVNSLMEGENGLDIFAVKNFDTYMEVNFMNQKFYINTQYINRDMGRLKQEIAKLFGS